MKPILIALAAAAIVTTPAFAALKAGDKAPDFTAPGFQAGKALTFSLAEARKKGPVVLYFFPAAQFVANGATVIGVTAGKLDKLQQISADADKCSGKFPVAADLGAKIARQYDAVLAARPDWSDRTSYVISPKGEVLHTYSKLDPSEHVAQTLGAVKAFKTKR